MVSLSNHIVVAYFFIPSLKELLEHVIVALEAVGLKVIQHSAENLHLTAVLQVTEEALEAHVGLGGDGLGDMREGLQVAHGSTNRSPY